MIFITGDTHSEVNRLAIGSFPEQSEMTKDDYVIILGDFGLVWNETNESKYEKWWLDWLNTRNFTTLFIDGNHENFDRLYRYKVSKWHGGKVHKIRKSVLHLMRGQVYEINGLKFFTFGGARSHDIKDGVFEVGDPKIKKWWNDRTKLFRINHVTWWKQEMPSSYEMNVGLENLQRNNFSVDYILTHDMSVSDLGLYAALHGHFIPEMDELEEYLEKIKQKTNYKKWFCGHYHDNKNVDNNLCVIYEQIMQIQ